MLSPLAALLVLAGLASGLWTARRAAAGSRAVACERAGATRLASDGPPGLPSPPGESLPSVTILVPARNEAARIPACLGSLLRLDYPAFDVVVINDGSTDDTGNVARRAAWADGRVTVVEAGPLPPGWGGKSHALWRGQTVARGAWLLFTDADTIHAPASLRLAVGQARARGVGLLSLSGRQQAVSAVERLVQPLVFEFLARRFPLAAVNDPADPRAAANGQYLLVSRALYDAIGGHAAVKGDLLEDVALARLAKRAGAGVAFLTAPDLVSVRMYAGARALWEGWTKNLADLSGGPRAALAEAASFLLRGGAPVVGLAAGLAALAARRVDLAAGPLALAAIGLVSLAAEGVELARFHGAPPAAGLLAPAGAVTTAALLAWSAWRRSGGREVVWRGRRYPAVAPTYASQTGAMPGVQA